MRDDRIRHGSGILVAEGNFLLAEMICDFLHDATVCIVLPADRP